MPCLAISRCSPSPVAQIRSFTPPVATPLPPRPVNRPDLPGLPGVCGLPGHRTLQRDHRCARGRVLLCLRGHRRRGGGPSCRLWAAGIAWRPERADCGAGAWCDAWHVSTVCNGLYATLGEEGTLRACHLCVAHSYHRYLNRCERRVGANGQVIVSCQACAAWLEMRTFTHVPYRHSSCQYLHYCIASSSYSVPRISKWSLGTYMVPVPCPCWSE